MAGAFSAHDQASNACFAVKIDIDVTNCNHDRIVWARKSLFLPTSLGMLLKNAGKIPVQS
jgi:hypothetical protein